MSRTKRFEEGKLVFGTGEAAKEAFFVVEGKVRIVPSIDRENDVIAEFGPGELFGEYAFILDNGKRTATAIAAQDGTVLEAVPGEDFRRRLDGLEPFLQRWIEELIRRSIPEEIPADVT
ncbi:cyclic nucleotide-binding domain-containing protein [Nisaea acidiphila]|uniref:Cyclic nucleotide-binding domain-containing protein n=1 Tax=Nisaea acidiphila TaxID=1862145 RepID=A0A9J7AR04_9PROT|nr:cyclic nucleotide-binding domain-containing protein [Nisaea acidiphila]UUX50043.1 cyclic nucleotide-binding domain-containing protein [Nisaea acidiphila]